MGIHHTSHARAWIVRRTLPQRGHRQVWEACYLEWFCAPFDFNALVSWSRVIVGFFVVGYFLKQSVNNQIDTIDLFWCFVLFCFVVLCFFVCLFVCLFLVLKRSGEWKKMQQPSVLSHSPSNSKGGLRWRSFSFKRTKARTKGMGNLPPQPGVPYFRAPQ